MENCLAFNYIAVDTEGFIPNPLGISIAHPGLDTYYYPIGHREDVNIDDETRERLFYVLKKVPIRVMHHAGHDLCVLPDLFDLPFVDTMVMAHMIDENLMSKRLDYLHKHYCDGAGKEMDPLMASIIKTMGWDYVPYALMNAYAGVDARITMELFMKMLPLFEAQFGPLWSIQ